MYIVVVKCSKDDPDFAYKAANTEMEGYRVSIIIAIATQLSEVGSGFMVSYDYCCRMQALLPLSSPVLSQFPKLVCTIRLPQHTHHANITQMLLFNYVPRVPVCRLTPP